MGRMAVLLAGLPVSVPAVTVNRLCGSSLDAAMQASRTVEAGDADVVLAGGVESMTRAPWVLPKPSRAFPAGNVDRGVDDAGLAAGQRPDAGGVDGLAGRGQRAARRTGSRSRGSGRTSSPPAPTTSPRRRGRRGSTTTSSCRSPVGVDLARDEGIRPGSSAEKLAGLKPSFRPDGTITAGQRLAAQRRCFGAAPGFGERRPAHFGAWPRWPGSPAAAPTRWRRRTSATRRSRRPRRRWPAPGSPGPTWRRSS